MSRATRNLLVGGCALLLAFELPTSLSTFFSGWRGPYAPAREDVRFSALVPRQGAALAGLLLLVRF